MVTTMLNIHVKNFMTLALMIHIENYIAILQIEFY